MKKIIVGLILFFMFIPFVKAQSNDNLVNIYFFHSESCKHCKSEINLLEQIEKEYSNVRVYKYEINENDNGKLFGHVTKLLGVNVSGVPFTIIGEKIFRGFNGEKSKREFIASVSYYSKYGYNDLVGEYIGNIELPSYEIIENKVSIDNYIAEYGNYNISFFGININTNNLDLSTSVVLMGISNIFSASFMLIMLSLAFLVINIKDMKKGLLFGGVLLISSFVCYFIFLMVFPNFLNYFENSSFGLIIGLIVIGFGLLNIVLRENEVINNIKNIFSNKNSLIVLFIVFFMILINLLSLNSNSELLLYFNNLLYLSNVSYFMIIIYTILYYFVYFIVNLLMFLIFIMVLNNLKIRNNKLFIRFSNILLIIIGVIIIIV